jgi:hypothetical protein
MTVLVADTAGDQVFDLVPEWDYVDGGHLSAPADDIAAGWFAMAYAVEVGAVPQSGGGVVGGGDALGHGGADVLDEVGGGARSSCSTCGDRGPYSQYYLK